MLNTPTDSTVRCTARTMHGMEDVLIAELEPLGIKDIKRHKRAVSFSTDYKGLYSANYLARTALSISLPLLEGTLGSERGLYNMARSIPWHEWFHQDTTIMVTGNIRTFLFRSTQYPVLLLKDAIVDHFRDRMGKRPFVDKDDPQVVIHLDLIDDRARISLDSSGEGLHRRGYRIDGGYAPLNEVLAAGLLQLSDFRGQETFLDPMCGSGTLPIEAALLAKNMPSQLFRKSFSFQHWTNYQERIWRDVVRTARGNVLDQEHAILASDMDPDIVTIARTNIAHAAMSTSIDLRQIDFFETKAPTDTGTIFLNPPYGERITVEDMQDFYFKMGQHIREEYGGWKVWIITSYTQGMGHFAMTPFVKHTLYNGPKEVRFYGFDVFE